MRTPLSDLKGVGPRTATALQRLGLRTHKDLLFFFPKRSALIHTGAQVLSQRLFHLRIDRVAQTPRYTRVQAILLNNPLCPVYLFFHRRMYHSIARKMSAGSLWSAWGSTKQGEYGVPAHALTLFFPNLLPYDSARNSVQEVVYPLTEGLSSKKIGMLVEKVLSLMPQAPSWDLEPFSSWPKFASALEVTHFLCPGTEDERHQALERLRYDRLMARSLLFLEMRRTHQQHPAPSLQKKPTIFYDSLTVQGLTLTTSQKEVLTTLHKDLTRTTPIRRLLQGDVGSGKTLVAFGALLQALGSGKSTAYLAPTEILAQQTVTVFKKFFPSAAHQCTLLTRTSVQKKKHLALIKDGRLPIVIGTHALLAEGVQIPNLGLLIIDEQQRFGVAQRAHLLKQAGSTPHLLMMTATPIPRTYSLMLKGDIETSYLKARVPSKRTVTLLEKKEISRLLTKITEALQKGVKLFWLCAAVEAKTEKTTVLERAAHLEKIFPGKVGCLYGAQRTEDKQRALALFQAGHTPVLVCTTVIETGIDIPDVSHMIIEDANHFGLAQLHQLRGRIGRAGQESFLTALYASPLSQTAQKRLRFFQACDDGFDLAHQDWDLRGEGDLFGTQQSGLLDPLLYGTHEELCDARQKAKHIAQHPEMANLLIALFERSDVPTSARAA